MKVYAIFADGPLRVGALEEQAGLIAMEYRTPIQRFLKSFSFAVCRGGQVRRRTLFLLGCILLPALLPPFAAGQDANQVDARAAGDNSVLQILKGDTPIDLDTLPFSRFGSYMVFSRYPQGLFLRELHNNAGRATLLNNAMRLEVLDNDRSIAFSETAFPTTMHLDSGSGTVDICFAEHNLIRFRAHGVGIRLTSNTPGNYSLQVGPQEWELHGPSKYRLAATHGELRVQAPWDGLSAVPTVAEFHPDRGDRTAEGFIGDYQSVWRSPASVSYEKASESVRSEYQSWLARIPPVPSPLRPAAERAAYLDWSSVVMPMGFLSRPAMLMSKNWQSSVWGWDHCFNAMAMLSADPQLAWNQFMLPFDHQDKDGQLPDRMNDEAESFRHTKPPIHGWVLRWMMEHSDSITPDKLQQIYRPLSRWTDWYFKYRDADHDGLPEYNHGDDAGWDNATIFLSAPPIESPDLAALLVIQMDVLSDVAAKLGRREDARQWHKRSDLLLQQMINAYWRDGQFVALRAFSHEETPRGSLLLYLPVLLGKRLPDPMRTQLISRLVEKGRFFTANGFATEELHSPSYDAGGYWRGPIWAPTTMMLEEGLKESGRDDLAEDIRNRFCAMVSRSGFAENFDAVTGAGSQMPDLDAPPREGRDPSYTWTASVFLIFAHEQAEMLGSGGHKRIVLRNQNHPSATRKQGGVQAN